MLARAVGLVAREWSGSAGEICSWVTHASCPPSRRVVKAQPCVRSFLLLGRDSGSQSTALIIEYVFLAGRQTQKTLLPPRGPLASGVSGSIE